MRETKGERQRERKRETMRGNEAMDVLTKVGDENQERRTHTCTETEKERRDNAKRSQRAREQEERDSRDEGHCVC